MTVLPIVERELRRAAKRPLLYRLRGAYASCAGVLVLWLLLDLSPELPQAALGHLIFGGLAWTFLFICLLVGSIATSDSISSEKRQGTLGLLFLTDLKGHDVILGKLAAHSLETVSALLAAVPLLCIPLLLGGVAAGELCRVTAALLAGLNLAVSVGIFVSTISHEERLARGGALLFISVLAIGLPGTVEVLRMQGLSPGPLAPLLYWMSPACPVYYAFSSTYLGADILHYWASLILEIGLASLLLARASFIVPWIWKQKGTEDGFSQWAGSVWKCRGDEGQDSRLVRRQLLDVNSVVWLSSRLQSHRQSPWILVGAVALIWLWSSWQVRQSGSTLTLSSLACVFLVQGFFKIWVAILATQKFAPDRESGALEILLCTPLTTAEILGSHWQALRRFFARPIAAVLLGDFLLATHHFSQAWLPGSDPPWGVAVLFGLQMGMFVADCLALAWVGLWMSLRRRTAFSALAATFLRIMVPPGLAVLLLNCQVWARAESTLLLSAAGWAAVGIGADLLFGVRARAGLRHQFRFWAAEGPRHRSVPSSQGF